MPLDGGEYLVQAKESNMQAIRFVERTLS